MTDREREMLKVIEELEWSAHSQAEGTSMGADNGPEFASCPCCDGIKPENGAESSFFDRAIGHTRNCLLGSVIRKNAARKLRAK